MCVVVDWSAIRRQSEKLFVFAYCSSRNGKKREKGRNGKESDRDKEIYTADDRASMSLSAASTQTQQQVAMMIHLVHENNVNFILLFPNNGVKQL